MNKKMNNNPKEPKEKEAPKNDSHEGNKNHSVHEKRENSEQDIKDLSEEVARKVKESEENIKEEKGKTEKTKDSKEEYVSVKKSEIDKLRQDLEEAKDRGLRALAELENYRNRTNRIMSEDRKYASMDLARSILPIWDDMGRALEAAEKEIHPEAVVDGIRMMHKQFLDILKKNQVEEIEALHQPFDPNIHESIAQFPNAEYPPNTVIIVSRPGFKLHDRVVRPAQVVLAAPAPKKQEEKE
ncbi:MAG: nucleotide exchange factor GrpE [Planctomycetia bacterium]|nr:nucleotide exchange factor GrpE [Planctomycetia bacterium]